MASPRADSQQSSSAETLYAAWRVDRDAGEGPTLDEFLARNPAHAEALRSIHANYEELGQFLHSGPRTNGGPTNETAHSRAPFSELIDRLRRHQPRESRYEVGSEIGRGGMGQLLELYDVDLRRSVAKKLMLSPEAKARGPAPSDPSLLGRFFEEAQVTAQLAHPGVVPVHELGIDEAGQVFFTMDLVRGSTLHDVYQRMRDGDEEWTLTRVVGVLVRVCETVAYAHSRGVLHRDLKPKNVMVGSFGEVYVMDWGLAKLLDERSAGKHAITTDPVARELPPVSTDRRDESSRDAFGGLRTETGHGAGTPGYMAIEQVLGQLRALDERTDVYALGAMLYELLTGQRPYEALIRGNAREDFVNALREGKARPIAKLAPEAPAELVSICERAMATRPDDRYATALEMAEDLRNWSEGRVVAAHERGAWAEMRKWVLRNKALAGSIAAILLTVVGGSIAIAWIQKARTLEVERKEQIAQVYAAPTILGTLQTGAERIWPSVPENIPKLESWLERWQELKGQKDRVANALALLDGRQSSFVAGDFDDGLREPLQELMVALDGSALPDDWVRERLKLARSVDETTSTSAAAQERWRVARDSIRALEIYRGLDLKPQQGLLPLEPDPESGLWEFWHVLSGVEPIRDPDTKRWRIEPETGIVLILIPQGTYSIGTPDVEPSHARHDPRAKEDKVQNPAVSVGLDAFFISRYEATQAQWGRARRAYESGFKGALTLPADTVSWNDAVDVLSRYQLTLPTEAQWEVAARAGSGAMFFSGSDPSGLVGMVVLDPELHRKWPNTRWGYEWKNRTESVGGRSPNAFGLHDALGNVKEWCLDPYNPAGLPRAGDGLRSSDFNLPARIYRGGSYNSTPSSARLGYRYPWGTENREPDTGVRPARSIQ